jgi:hypothetical protein
MAKKKEETKLLSLSRVLDKEELDSVKASKNRFYKPYERAFSILLEAQRYYNNMDNFRKRRLRNKRYCYGDQWGDTIEFKSKCGFKKRIKEEDYIREQGSEPLKNNLIRRLVKNVLGVYRSQSKEPTCNARDKDEKRYLVVVDIGGRSKNADWSVICVFDRYWMMEGGKPYVVAQWYGHIDMDLLAWKAAQIAKYYNDALLVIESNTLETKDKEHILEGGDQSEFILNQIKDVYDNLYARKQSESDIKNKVPVKYGFHTNVATKPMVISVLVQVIREQLYVERDDRCLDEYLTYEKNGTVYEAADGKHDDLLMTRAIGLHICFNEMEMPKMIQIQARVMRRKVSVSAATII